MSRNFFVHSLQWYVSINGLRLINFSIKIILFTLTSWRSITWTLKILTIWIVPLIKSEHIDRRTNHDKTGLNPRRKTNENYQYLKLGCLQNKELKPSYNVGRGRILNSYPKSCKPSTTNASWAKCDIVRARN